MPFALDINWETLKTRDAPIVPNTQIVYEKKDSFSIDPFLFAGDNNEVINRNHKYYFFFWGFRVLRL